MTRSDWSQTTSTPVAQEKGDSPLARPSTPLTAGEVFELLQFHFHAPAEHTIAGKHAAMEAHFVHRNSAGKLAVVGVMMRSGAHNQPLASVFANMPTGIAPKTQFADARIDASAVVPSERRAYFHYKGSLTTPPCSEGVQWFVLADAIEVSPVQIRTFERILGSNSRPLQRLNDRLLIGSP